MVGRSSRQNVSKQDSTEEREFPSLDKSKKWIGSSQRDEDDNILDGFDVEGLTEREKEDLKKAVLESKNDMPGQCIGPIEEKCSNIATDINEQKAVGNIEDEDDDETQPPEDMEVDFALNLIEPTLVDMDESTEEVIPEDKEASPVVDDKSVPNSNKIKNCQFGSSQSFERRDDDTEVDGCKASLTPAHTQSNTQESNNCKQSQETKSMHQKNSQTAVPSCPEDDSKIDSVHVPLRRHYRAVSTQTVKTNDYFCSRGNAESERSVKAIYQLFEIFRMKLKEAQRQCREKLPWGEPVKSGSHQSRTIDIKRRGQDSCYIDLSEDEDIEIIPESTRGRKPRKHESQSQNNSDEDLPDLLVEDSRSEVFKGMSLRRRKLHDKSMETQTKASVTPQSDLKGENSDNDFQVLKQRNVERIPRQIEKHDTDFADSTHRASDTKRTRKQRSGKKVGASNKVLVEETQEQFGFEEKIITSKIDSEITVSETQAKDDDFDWLNVRKTASGERFENPMHQAKLKDYSIRRVPHSKRHNKITEAAEFNEDNSVDSLDSLGGKQEKEEVRSNEDKDTEIKENQQPDKRKKRKAKKTENKVLVEETQDLDADYAETKSGGKRAKRKCFRLGSSSEEESVAETQDMDDTPEYKLEEGNDVCVIDLNSNENEIGNKNCELDETSNGSNETKFGTNSEIKKRKKPCVHFTEKGVIDPVNLDEGNEIKANITKTLPCERKLRTVSGNRTNVRKGKMLKNSALDTGTTAKDDLPKGVRKLLNRPVSKESIDSNISDDLSITSSQRSGMIIDDQGDLYSTQFCEIKGRKRKTVQDSKANSLHTFKQKMNVFEEIMTIDSSDADISKPEADKFDPHSLASNMKKTLRTSSSKNQKGGKITQYLNKSVGGVSSNSPIDIDSDLDGDEKRKEEGARSQNSNQETCGNIFVKRGASVTNTQPRKGKVLISLNDLATEKEVQQVKADINQPAYEVKPVMGEVKLNANDNSKGVETNEDEENADSSPDIFLFESGEDPLGDIRERKRPTVRKKVNSEGSVPQTATWVEDHLDDSSKDALQRNDANRGMRGNEKFHHGRGRKRQYSEEEQERKEIKTIVCPMCDCAFSEKVIEAHAAECNGPVLEKEKTNHPSIHSSHGRTEDNVGNQLSTRSNNKRRHRATSPEDNQLDFVEQSNKVGADFDGLKLLSDTGQEEEAKTCWICEHLIKDQYELHVERCFAESAKLQREIEEKGFRETKREPDVEEASPARTTRGRLRQQHDGGDMPRQKGNNVKVMRVEQTVRERNQRDDREVPPARSGRSVGKKKQERTDAFKTTLLEDGYNSDKTKYAENADSTDGSSWNSESSTDSSDDDNISLASVVRSGSSALVSGPWNKPTNNSKNVNQSTSDNGIPDWIKDGISSPIKSFVPISQQEDSEYFQKQFSYRQKNVEKRMQKRKRSTGNKKRRKRRKVRRTKKQ